MIAGWGGKGEGGNAGDDGKIPFLAFSARFNFFPLLPGLHGQGASVKQRDLQVLYTCLRRSLKLFIQPYLHVYASHLIIANASRFLNTPLKSFLLF